MKDGKVTGNDGIQIELTKGLKKGGTKKLIRRYMKMESGLKIL